MDKDIKIVKASYNEVPDVIRFICENFVPEIHGNIPELEGVNELDFDSFVNYFHKLEEFGVLNCIYVAYDNDDIVGVSSGRIEKHPWFVSTWGHEHFWFVKKEYRKLSCGKILFEKLIQWFKENNAKRIKMSHYSWNNGLSKFYNKNGFIPYETHYVLKEGV